MAKYKLDDVCEFITDGTHQTPEYCDEGGVIFLSSKDVTERKINWDDVKHIPNSLHEKLYKRLSPRKDDILLAKNGTTGVAAIVDKNEIFDVYVSLAVLRPLTTINPKYLLYAINSPVVKNQFDAGLKGVGVPNLHLSVIRETVINVVGREEQEKICVVLDKIAGVIDKRKAELNELDNFIKARFVEMFGDPNAPRDSENKYKIGELCDVTKLAGFEFTEYINYQDSGEIIMLRGLNCKQGTLVLDDVKYIDRETSYKLPRSRLYAGDILMTYAGTIGDVAIVDEDNKYHLAPNVAKISINDREKLSPVFLVHLFMYSHNYIMTFASQVAQASINMQKIRDFEYNIPPIEQQIEFEQFANQVNKSKVVTMNIIRYCINYG